MTRQHSFHADRAANSTISSSIVLQTVRFYRWGGEKRAILEVPGEWEAV